MFLNLKFSFQAKDNPFFILNVILIFISLNKKWSFLNSSKKEQSIKNDQIRLEGINYAAV